jgi:hypothetical protein
LLAAPGVKKADSFIAGAESWAGEKVLKNCTKVKVAPAIVTVHLADI